MTAPVDTSARNLRVSRLGLEDASMIGNGGDDATESDVESNYSNPNDVLELTLDRETVLRSISSLCLLQQPHFFCFSHS